MSSNVAFKPVDAWYRPDILTATFFVNFMGLILPLTILQVYDRIIPNVAYATFTILVAMVAGAIGLEAVFKILRARIFSAIGARYEHSARTCATSKLLEANRRDFSDDSPGGYSDKIQSIQSIRDFYSGQAASLAIDIPFVILFLALIYLIAGILVLIPIVLLGFLSVIIYLLNKDLTRAIHHRNETDRRRHNFLIETLRGVHIVKALSLERLMLRRYERLQARSSKGVVDFSVLQSASVGLAATFSQLSTVTYVSLGSFFVIDGSLTLGGLAAGTMLTGRVLQPVMRGLSLWNRYQEVRITQSRLNNLFNMPSESPKGSLALNSIEGEIELRNVSFKHRPDSEDIFSNISLKIPTGTLVGFTGPNGCGLSTLLSLLNGTVKPTSGQILIDGHDISTLDQARLRKHVSLVPEEGDLFNGTLLENLTFFREGEYKTRAIQALGSVGLDQFVLSLPKGLETPLGGSVMSNLPLGIVQKIVIARSIVNDPAILLFDNANSGLDMKSDEHIRQLIAAQQSEKTIILGTYRPSYLKLCDQVYEVIDKTVVLRGATANQANRKDGPETGLSKGETPNLREAQG